MSMPSIIEKVAGTFWRAPGGHVKGRPLRRTAP